MNTKRAIYWVNREMNSPNSHSWICADKLNNQNQLFLAFRDPLRHHSKQIQVRDFRFAIDSLNSVRMSRTLNRSLVIWHALREQFARNSVSTKCDNWYYTPIITMREREREHAIHPFNVPHLSLLARFQSINENWKLNRDFQRIIWKVSVNKMTSYALDRQMARDW